MNTIGKPCEGKLQARFDEGGTAIVRYLLSSLAGSTLLGKRGQTIKYLTMPIIRCSEQTRLTLEEFYNEFVPDKVNTFADVGTPMLNVLKLINETFKETTIYGLTSHATLLLLNEDSSLSPWFVALNGLESEYYIEYTMTPDKQPWNNAKVKGGTKSLIELKKLIIIAMTESGGWTASRELDKLHGDLTKTDGGASPQQKI